MAEILAAGWAAFQRLDEDDSPTMLTRVNPSKAQVIADAWHEAFSRTSAGDPAYQEFTDTLMNDRPYGRPGHGWRIWIEQVTVTNREDEPAQHPLSPRTQRSLEMIRRPVRRDEENTPSPAGGLDTWEW